MIFNEIFYENNQRPNDILFVRQAGEVMNDPCYSISRKGSPTHTIGVLKDGKLKLKTKNTEICVKGGQCVYFPRDISYTICADKLEPPNFVWINLRGKLIDGMAEALFGGAIAIAETDLTDLTDKVCGFLKRRENRDEEISLAVFGMLQKIFKARVSLEREENSASEYEVYISNSIQSGFSVEAMAEYFHCSAATLNRRFEKRHKMTPYRYYQRLRIEIAKTMLAETELTIEDIAERLYFNERNHFSVCFKKLTGRAPAEYRKNIKY